MGNWKMISENKDERLQVSINPVTETIPVVKEHLHVGTKMVEAGRVNISKKVLTENYTADIPVLKEEVIVEKKAINQYIDGEAPSMRLDGDTTIIPVLREVMVKRLLLVEEIHITKRRTAHTVPVNEVLRKEEVTVTRTESPATGQEQ
ncbi:YsnF/AvaK domain-containing protein [Mucilaginibacter sp. PAMB04274]|uniref:YsnF/AvaK domain-containing protein n=1 Tax=Mucilaginibacter sp. PAMB04274 TaxID=3138568 RepID=UPI0031F663F9